MKKLLLMIVMLLSTFSAASYAEVFKVHAPEYIDDSLENYDISQPVQVQIVQYDTMQELSKAYDRTGKFYSGLLAFQVWNGDICEIHVITPYGWNDIQRQADLGHELLHCYGAHHDNTL